jgi:hypothetical protein
MRPNGVRGPLIYDSIIGHIAWKNDADVLLTINKKHFDMLFPRQTARIVSPVTTG